MLDNLKSILQTVSPILATALGSPIAGVAVSAISTALFGHSDATAGEIEGSLSNMTPEIVLKLKEAENAYLIDHERLQLEEEKLPYEERANARGREIAVKDNTPRNLAYAITIGFFIFLFTIIFVRIQPDMHDIVISLTSILSTTFVGIIGYYFGTSTGSKSKDEIVAHLATQGTKK